MRRRCRLLIGAEPVIETRLKAGEERLRSLKKRYGNDHVVFIDRIPDAVIKKIVFKKRDPMHQQNADAFISYMTANTDKLVKIHDTEKGAKP